MTIVAVLFSISTYVLIMGTAIFLVTATSLASDLFNINRSPPLGVFYIYASFTRIPLSVNLLALSWFCIIVFTACFLAGLRSRSGFLQSLRKLTLAGRVTSDSNWLVVMPLLSSALLIVVVIITILLNATGVPSGSLCDPKINAQCPSQAELFAGLAYAPISEELAFRILTPLSVVVLIRTIWKYTTAEQGISISTLVSLVGASILSPEHAKSKAGLGTFSRDGWRSVHWAEWIFIFFSSILFGLAHIESGGGTNWAAGKAVTAAISGLALGVSYLAYGAYGAILLHWFFDFYVEVLTLGFPPLAGPVSLFVNLIVLIGLLAIGTLSLIVAIVWLIKRVANRFRPTPYMTPEAPPHFVQ